MEFNRLHEYVQVVTTLLVDGFVLGFTALIIAIIVMYIADITQTSHAIRRNYPVVGRFRYLFENMGEFFRQYFFAQDREELPFNRAERACMFALGCIQALQCNKNSYPTGTTTNNPSLQKGLVVSDKAERVKNYCHNMNYEVGVIAHACGVEEPRRLSRRHARVVTDTGQSISLKELHELPINAD